MLAGSTTTAIPSIATTFSTTPAAFSSSFNALEELPMSTLPAVTASIPAEEPVNSAVTVTPGYFAIKLSATAFASFSMEVLPAMEMLPLRSAPASCEASSCAVVSSAAASSAATSCAASVCVSAASCVCPVCAVSCEVAPHAISPAVIAAALISASIFLLFLIFHISSFLYECEIWFSSSLEPILASPVRR